MAQPTITSSCDFNHKPLDYLDQTFVGAADDAKTSSRPSLIV